MIIPIGAIIFLKIGLQQNRCVLYDTGSEIQEEYMA